jgi:aminoglycoside phosphotransferase (APT) family kinase protein
MTQALGKILGSGANADVYEYGEGKVVKLYRSMSNMDSIQLETRNNQFAAQTGVPMAKFYGNVEINGLPGLVFERIDGETVADRLFSTMDTGYVLLLARLMHSIHTAPIDHLDTSDMLTVRDVLDWQISHGSGLTDNEKESVKGLVMSLPDQECFCHSDLNPKNVIIRKNEPIVIDWQGSCIGHPAYDVMQLVLVWKYAVLPPEQIPPEIIKIFAPIRNEINDVFCAEYCRLSGLCPADLEPWLAPMAAAKLNTDLCDEERAILLEVVRAG